MVDPNIPGSQAQAKEAQEAMATIGVHRTRFRSGFVTMTRERVEALLVTSSPYFNNLRVELIVLAARHQTPAIYEFHEFVDAGGVMSYGTSLTEGTRHSTCH